MILEGGRKKRKSKSKPKKKTKARPPRIFVSKGKLYIRIGKKKYLLQDQQDYTKKELLDIIFKELLVRRKRRKRGKYTKREKKLDEEEKKTFESFERLNRSKSSVRGLSIPSSIKLRDRTSSSSLFNSVIPWSQTAIQPLVPQIDINLQTQKLIDAERKKQIELKKEEKKQTETKALIIPPKEEKKQIQTTKSQREQFEKEQTERKAMMLRIRRDDTANQMKYLYDRLDGESKKIVRKQYYDFFKGLEADIRKEEDPNAKFRIQKNFPPEKNYRRTFMYLLNLGLEKIGNLDILEQFIDFDFPPIEKISSSPPPLEEETKQEEEEEPERKQTLINPYDNPSPFRKELLDIRQDIKLSKNKKKIKEDLRGFVLKYNSENPNFKLKLPPKGISADRHFVNISTQLYNQVLSDDDLFKYIYEIDDLINPEETSASEVVELKTEQKEEKEGKAIEPQTQSESESEAEQVRAEIIQQASGYYKGDGLNTSEINNIMKYHKNYVGCFPSNFNKYLPNKMPNPCGFIMNLDNDKKKGSHWVAVYIDKNSSIEYYDSFAKEPTKDFMKRLNKLISKLKPHTYLKMKINKIKEQNLKSNNCGFFACKFLIDRFNNKPFKECSGYDNSIKGEKDIKKLINKYPTFNYI